MHLSDVGPVSRVFVFVFVYFFNILSILGSGCSLMAARLQAVCSFQSALRAYVGGLRSLMTVTSLFTDMAGNTPFLMKV